MSGSKTEFNNQFGRTAADGGDAVPASQTPAPADNQGKEPLTDRFGRFWVLLANATPGLGQNVVPIPGAVDQADDALERFINSANIIPTFDVVAGPGKIYWVTALNPTNSDRFLMVFDAAGAGAPVNTNVPVISIAIPDQNMNKSAEINLLNLGLRFSDRLKLAISETPMALTLPATGDYWVTALYRT